MLKQTELKFWICFNVLLRCWRRWSRQRRKLKQSSTLWTSQRRRRWLSWRGTNSDAEHVKASCSSLLLLIPLIPFFFVSSIYKKAGVGKEKREVTYVVTKKGAGRKVRRPPGVKGAFKVVDSRLKKDMRGMKRKEQRAKGNKGKQSKGGKGRQKSGKGRK